MNGALSDLSMAKSSDSERGLSTRPVVQLLALSILFAVGVAIRIHGIGGYLLDYYPTKQYRAALTARAYYYESVDSIPEWRKEVAHASVQRLGTLGPTVIEHIAAVAYLVTGAEELWIPRLLSSLFWIVGGGFLYLLARELASPLAALVTTAFFVFLPFAVTASQSFQPDPLMVMMMIISLLAIVRFHQLPSMRRLLGAGIAAGAAVLIKPVCLFIILGAFAALALGRHGVRKSIRNHRLWLFTCISLLPTGLYYGYGILANGVLRGQAESSFVPGLVLDPFFWQFWLKHIHRAIGFEALLGGLMGIFLVRAGWRRRFVVGLWIGYVVYGLAFTYHIHTHVYYQLPFVPIVALSLGPLGASVLSNLIQEDSQWRSYIIVGGVFLLAVLLNIGLYLRERQELPDFRADVALAEEIGAAVGHSTQTLLLAAHYGRPLQYHGELSGEPWPTSGDLRSEKLVGRPQLTAEERFSRLDAALSPEYFIVTEFEELNNQTDLKAFLKAEFPILSQTDDYLIYDLRDTPRN